MTRLEEAAKQAAIISTELFKMEDAKRTGQRDIAAELASDVRSIGDDRVFAEGRWFRRWPTAL